MVAVAGDLEITDMRKLQPVAATERAAGCCCWCQLLASDRCIASELWAETQL